MTDNQPTEPPPHMHPMTTDEVGELLSATMHGPLPQVTMQRVMATLAEWAPIIDRVTRRVTPPRAVIDATVELFNNCVDPGDLAIAFVAVLRTNQLDHTTVRELHTKACIAKGWKPS